MRIISLAPGATEILFAVGSGPHVVGRTSRCDFPEEAAALPIVDLPAAAASPSVTIVDVDALLDLEPDLVVGIGGAPRTAGGATLTEAFAELSAAPRLMLAPADSLEDAIETIVRIGQAALAHRGAARLAGRLRARLGTVRSMVAPRARPRVAVIEWPDPLYTPNAWVPGIVRAAGGESVFGADGEPSRPATADELARAAPEVLVTAFHGLSLYEMQARLRRLIAGGDWPRPATSMRMVAMDATFLDRPGPRLATGVELLAWALHRPHPAMQPPVGRVAELIEAGWVDLAAIPAQVDQPAT